MKKIYTIKINKKAGKVMDRYYDDLSKLARFKNPDIEYLGEDEGLYSLMLLGTLADLGHLKVCKDESLEEIHLRVKEED
jgi:hypothetical protein